MTAALHLQVGGHSGAARLRCPAPLPSCSAPAPPSSLSCLCQSSASLLSELSSLLSEVDSEISASVLSRHSSLLSQASNISALQQKLTAAQSRLRSLVQSLSRVQSALSAPYARLCSDSLQLAAIQSACELVRQCQRVAQVVDRMRALQPDSGELKDAVRLAACVHEALAVMTEADLSGVDAVDSQRPFIAEAERRVREEGRRALQLSLESGHQTETGQALQLFFNLGAAELVAAVDETVARAFDSLVSQLRRMADVTTLSTTAAAARAPAAAKPGPASASSAAGMSTFRSTLWDRVDTLLASLHSLCLQLAGLQTVLDKKRDPASHLLLADAYAAHRRGGGSGGLADWWAQLLALLEQELEATSRGSSFVKSVFVNEFPRLHAAFHALQLKLDAARAGGGGGGGGEATATSLLRCIAVFESGFLTRSLVRLHEPLQLMQSASSSLPTRSDCVSLVQHVGDALSSVHDSEAALQAAVAGNVSKSLQAFAAQAERLLNLNDDRDVLGAAAAPAQPASLSPVQRHNSELFALLLQVELPLSPAELSRKYPSLSAAALSRVRQGWQAVRAVSDAVLLHLFRNVVASVEAALVSVQDDEQRAARGGLLPAPADGSEPIASLRRRLTALLKTTLPAYTAHDPHSQLRLAPHLQQRQRSSTQRSSCSPRFRSAKPGLCSPSALCSLCSDQSAVPALRVSAGLQQRAGQAAAGSGRAAGGGDAAVAGAAAPRPAAPLAAALPRLLRAGRRRAAAPPAASAAAARPPDAAAPPVRLLRPARRLRPPPARAEAARVSRGRGGGRRRRAAAAADCCLRGGGAAPGRAQGSGRQPLCPGALPQTPRGAKAHQGDGGGGRGHSSAGRRQRGQQRP